VSLYTPKSALQVWAVHPDTCPSHTVFWYVRFNYHSSSNKMSSTDVQHCQSKLFSNSTTNFDLTVSLDSSAWAVILGSW